MRTIVFPAAERHHVRRLGRDRPQRHRHRLLFGRKSVHPGKIRGVARRRRGAARKRTALPDHHLHHVRTGLRRGLARRRPRHARCRDRSGARQGVGRSKGDAREQRRARIRSAALEGNWRAARAYIYGTAAEVWADVKRTGNLTEEHRLALRLASTWTIHQALRWSMPPITWPAPPRCSLQQVRTPLPRHACHRPADPGPRHPL